MEKQRICGNCALFYPHRHDISAIDVETAQVIEAGRRTCSAGNIAWADSPCTTGEFTPKAEPKIEVNC